MACIFVLGMAAASFAASSGPTVEANSSVASASLNSNKESLSVTYKNAVKDDMYLVLYVQGIAEGNAFPEINKNTILYIDQKTASANGDLSFDNVYPKTLSNGTVILTSSAAGTDMQKLATVEVPFNRGDVSGDLLVNYIDARMVMQHSVKYNGFQLEGNALQAALLNEDAVANYVDARIMMQVSVNMPGIADRYNLKKDYRS